MASDTAMGYLLSVVSAGFMGLILAVVNLTDGDIVIGYAAVVLGIVGVLTAGWGSYKLDG